LISKLRGCGVPIASRESKFRFLPWAMQAARQEELDGVKFQSNFFAQLAPQTFLWLFAPLGIPPGIPQPLSGSKDVIEQEDSIVVVKDQRPGSGRETPMTKAHHADDERRRAAAPIAPRKSVSIRPKEYHVRSNEFGVQRSISGVQRTRL